MLSAWTVSLPPGQYYNKYILCSAVSRTIHVSVRVTLLYYIMPTKTRNSFILCKLLIVLLNTDGTIENRFNAELRNSIGNSRKKGDSK